MSSTFFAARQAAAGERPLRQALQRSEVGLHGLGGLLGVLGDDDGEGHVVRGAELIAPQDEVLDLGDARILDELIEAVDEDVADVEIARMQAADEALQERQRTHGILLIVDQANADINIVTELGALFDADHAAGFVLYGLVDVGDELLGLAGTLQPHDQFDHRMILLCSSGRAGYEKAPAPSGTPSLISILPSFYPDCNTNLHIRPAASVRIQDGASKKTFTAASRAAAARRNAARSRAERKNFSDDCALLCTETVEKSR